MKTFQNPKAIDSSEEISYRPIDNVELIELLHKYETFRQKTMNGEHGKTTQFFMNYVDLINNYLLFDRSVRTGDLNLFIFSMGKFINLFFTFNHQNYARYLTLYMVNLQNRHLTHPRLEITFSVKLTNKPFSKQPIDYTVETTINLDASKRTRYLTNTASGRNRWTKSHALRTQIISHVMHEAFLEPHDEVTNDLSKNKI